MALVDYSSDEIETDVEEDDKEKQLPLPQQMTHHAALSSSSSSSAVAASDATDTVKVQPGSCVSRINSGGTSLKLPDASALLASFGDAEEKSAVHSGVRAVISGKRSDLNGSADGPHKKIPKGNLMPSRILPDTADGLLLPPQLRGRSNVATEDLDKLFTKRRKPT